MSHGCAHSMKTIFVTSFHQFISRNILHTPILEGLLAIPDVRVVIFAPKDKKEYFEREFAGKGLYIECVDISRSASGFWSLFMKRAAQAMGGFRYKEIARGFRINPFRAILLTIFFRYPVRLFGKVRVMHRVMRFCNLRLVRNEVCASAFARYAPDLLFSTDAQNESDVILMTEARRRKIPIISMVRSWDNVEMYGVLRVIPETLLVWGDFVKREILKANTMDEQRVKLVGIPHYDRYLKGPTMPREQFLKSLGADPHRRLIFYTPVGDMYLKENDVDGVVLSELAKFDANILVRTPPADTVSFGDFIPPANVFFYHPGTGVDRAGRREISRADDDHLINSLRFSDVVVSGPSTIMLDAILLDKPVVLFGFERTKKSHEESMASLYDSRHLQTVIQNKGVQFAKTPEEFQNAIAGYLRNPQKDTEGRKRAVEFVCFKTDGTSCERVLDALRSALIKSSL